MAGSVDKVNELTLMLREKALPAARSELETLTAFAKSKGFTDEKLALWDVAFWSERQSEELFGFEEEELRPYFALPNVCCHGRSRRDLGRVWRDCGAPRVRSR